MVGPPCLDDGRRNKYSFSYPGSHSAVLQHFEGYDPEGFSIYFIDYKYPEENTVNFIVMNKVRSPSDLLDNCRVCMTWAVVSK